MYPIYRWLYNQFAFSRNQSNGFLILLPLVILIVFSEPAYRWWIMRRPPPAHIGSVKLDSLMALFKPVEHPETLRKDSSRRTPEKNRSKLEVRRSAPVTRKEPASFDLNQADTTQLKGLPGIGPRLAARIIRYREALGGFHSPDQLFEVYGLDSGVVHLVQRYARIDTSFIPKRIDINTATREELANHPYISSSEASAIVTYRFKHGRFSSIEDLERLYSINRNRLGRMLPYLTVD